MIASALLLATLQGAALTGPGGGGPAGDTPADARHPTLSRVDVVDRAGARLPLEAALVDEDGRTVRLAAYMAGERPVLLVLGYYRCRMLCGVVLEGLVDALGATEGVTAGRDVSVVAVSIDPREGPTDARTRREEIRGRAGDLDGWTFLTARREADVRALADSVGFRYAYDPATDQFAHAAAVFAVGPSGTVTGTLYGVSFPEADLREAVAAAAAERPGLSLEKVLVRCFRYTPALQRHAGLIAHVLQGGGLAILLGLAGVFVLAGRRAVAEREGTP